jgi:glycosyltransferase involved in cell wall biosynthesis
MNILFVANTIDELNGFAPISGGERQLLGLAKALRARGHTVEIANVFREELPYEKLSTFDIVHLFGSGAPKGVLLNVVRVVHRFYHKPVFFTPVWWPRDAVIQAAQQLSTESVKVEVFDDFEESILLAELCRMVDMLLLNSSAEHEQIKQKLLLGEDRPWRVVHNAVDLEELNASVAQGATQDYILCVGRIELRKNQHTLVKAMKLLQEPPALVLIGSFEKAYTDLWREEMNGLKVQHIPHSAPNAVFAAMRSCRVYAQPSFYETPGLAAMEAAALGCPVVIGELAAEREYFQDYAYYCNPLSVESVAEALQRAIADGAHLKLREHIRSFTYARAAEEVEHAYKELV